MAQGDGGHAPSGVSSSQFRASMRCFSTALTVNSTAWKAIPIEKSGMTRWPRLTSERIPCSERHFGVAATKVTITIDMRRIMAMRK